MRERPGDGRSRGHQQQARGRDRRSSPSQRGIIQAHLLQLVVFELELVHLSVLDITASQLSLLARPGCEQLRDPSHVDRASGGTVSRRGPEKRQNGLPKAARGNERGHVAATRNALLEANWSPNKSPGIFNKENALLTMAKHGRARLQARGETRFRLNARR